jgi:hypothetical protein
MVAPRVNRADGTLILEENSLFLFSLVLALLFTRNIHKRDEGHEEQRALLTSVFSSWGT